MFGIASTNPAPSVLVEMRNVRTLSAAETRSTIRGSVAREWINEPPSDSKNTPPSRCPVRCSATWLAPPVATFWWHSRHDCAL